MKLSLLLIFVFSLASSASADELNVLSLLKRDLGNGLEVHSEKEVRYCPDNTCEIFKTSKLNPDFPKFVYMYLFHKSDYIYLHVNLNEAVVGKQKSVLVASEESKIRSSLASYCPNNPSDPYCIVEGMLNDPVFQVCFGRYDENKFCYTCEGGETVCNEL